MNGESEPRVTGRGAQQGCPLSLLLFSIFCGGNDVRGNGGNCGRSRVGGEFIKDVRFADDQGMVASTEQGLQKVMNALNETSKKYDTKVNLRKTKAMVV
jgi:Reverse transcriptase (RNA-dependent DNA polymerase)